MSLYSINEALERFENDAALWSEFAETWLETVQADHDGFTEALEAGNSRAALYHIHKLKGASATIGATGLASISQSLELEIRELRIDGAKALSAGFNEVFALSIRETRRLIAGFRTPGQSFPR